MDNTILQKIKATDEIVKLLDDAIKEGQLHKYDKPELPEETDDALRAMFHKGEYEAYKRVRGWFDEKLPAQKTGETTFVCGYYFRDNEDNRLYLDKNRRLTFDRNEAAMFETRSAAFDYIRYDMRSMNPTQHLGFVEQLAEDDSDD